MTARNCKIGYGIVHDAPSAEHDAALEWLRSEFERVTVVRLHHENLPPYVDALWIHAPDGEAYHRQSVSPEVRTALRDFIVNGGRLLCTNRAAYLPHDIGIESVAPQTVDIAITDEGYGRGRGFQSYGHHPLFEAFFGGGFVWNAAENHEAARVGYFDNAWPEQGHVLGIDKAYITLDQDSKLVVEHRYGEGAVLSVGGYIHLSRPNRNDSQLRLFLKSAIKYLLEAPEIERTQTWCRDECEPVSIDVSSTSLQLTGSRSADPNARGLPSLTRKNATDAFFDVAGRRCVVMGTEHGGIDEVWCHPFRILYDLEAGIVTDDGATWLRDVPSSIEVMPHAFVRRYQLDGGLLEEVIFTAKAEPAAAIRFRVDHDLRLIIRYAADFRWMWPYREETLGSIFYGYDEAVGGLHLRDRSSRFYAMYGADRAPEQNLAGQYSEISFRDGLLAGSRTESNIVRHAAVYALDPRSDRTLHFGFAGSSIGRDDANSAYRRVLECPEAALDEAASHFEQLLSRATTLTSPDPEFNEGYRWAIIGTDRFWVDTPGIGTGLLAGYGTTKKGWNGGHQVNGRPGYGWYFARDAAWSCFAVNNYGDFDSVCDELRLFQKYQEPSGKVFFEIPLSGIVHYDSADSTPLYVILAGHYLRSSGDVGTIKSLWPSLLRAIDFLYATDTTGDGFIENRNVGHGWVEGGDLFGVQTELYLAGLWVRALRESAYMAGAIGDAARARRFTEVAEQTRLRLEREFMDGDDRFLRFAKLDDASFNAERTVFASIPLMYRLIEDERARPMLDAFAGNEFSTDWGTHIISTKSDLFDPQGYHLGTVWPLFTGWTALAEYAYQRPVSGFTHVMNNLLVYREGALGFVEEVLNGERYLPAGVCAHQCWSETNVIHPLLEGMLGIEPDALAGLVSLRPQLPIDWDWLNVNNIRIGDATFDLAFERNNDLVRFDFRKTTGPAVDIILAPEFPRGTTVHTHAADVSIHEQETSFRFRLLDTASIAFVTSGGIGVVPVIPHSHPGDRSGRTRIIDELVVGDTYSLIVEGAPRETATFRIRHFGPAVARAVGADIISSGVGDEFELETTFPDSDAPWVRHEIRLELDPTSAIA